VNQACPVCQVAKGNQVLMAWTFLWSPNHRSHASSAQLVHQVHVGLKVNKADLDAMESQDIQVYLAVLVSQAMWENKEMLVILAQQVMLDLKDSLVTTPLAELELKDHQEHRDRVVHEAPLVQTVYHQTMLAHQAHWDLKDHQVLLESAVRQAHQAR